MTTVAASAGLHHITAICGDPAENVHFYTQVLGLRLVKRTVNFDDPGTWHLYYGDRSGQPGTALTFFPFQNAPSGQPGTGEAFDIAFAVPEGSLDFWVEQLGSHGVALERRERFGQPVLSFDDPHGNALSLVAADWAEELPGWESGPLLPEHAIRGFFGVGLRLAALAPTAHLLEEVLGFERIAEEHEAVRFRSVEGSGLGAVVDVHVAPAPSPARQGVGSIHHIAFRARDDDHEMALRAMLGEMDIEATEQVDRQYFRSVYFREPGGVLFELATDAPGFEVDEPLERLGERLMLPAPLEGRRAMIEAALPPLS